MQGAAQIARDLVRSDGISGLYRWGRVLCLAPPMTAAGSSTEMCRGYAGALAPS